MPIIPDAFKERMLISLGAEFEKFELSLDDASPASIRYNPAKALTGNIHESIPWSKCGEYLPARPVYTMDPQFHAGKYYVQEASSMFLEHAIRAACNLNEPLKVLDLCAAPGGKSTHVLGLINDKSLLVSNEVIRSRASILSENIQKWGYPNTLVTNNDPADFAKLEGYFDVIIVDAPCSGEGLFRKDPSARDEWSIENVALCSARQRRILHDVWPALKKGGILIYCTCTYNEDENENNLDQFSQQQRVKFIDLKPDPSWNIEVVKKNEVIGYRFLPHRLKGEGFFLSAFTKENVCEEVSTRSKRKFVEPSKSVTQTVSGWITNLSDYVFRQHNDLVFLIPSNRASDLEFLIDKLKLVYMGVNVATLKHAKLIPEHSLALAICFNHESFQKIVVTKDDALRYLRRESLPNDGDLPKGFSVIEYEGSILGFVNVLPNRINNMYPQEWRIRMAPL